jgi:hypothetical protein
VPKLLVDQATNFPNTIQVPAVSEIDAMFSVFAVVSFTFLFAELNESITTFVMTSTPHEIAPGE